MFSEFRKVNDLISSSILYEENSWSKRFNHLEADILSISEKISENKKVEQVDWLVILIGVSKVGIENVEELWELSRKNSAMGSSELFEW